MAQKQDRISQVFKDRTVFLTGGSGFLGKILVEKLLRCCEVKKLFLLMREKKGKTPEERLGDIFSNVLFDRLKSLNPSSLKKCHIISGDISKPNLGMSPQDQHLLLQEVDFIVHSAASTRFDDSLEKALAFNTICVKELLDLAEKCKKLKVLVHVSTAYSFPREKVLFDKGYKTDVDVKEVLEKVDRLGEKETKKLLGDHPNTYTFSKALAEQLVMDRMNKVPAIIVRPSVVCPTWREPIKGWCNNLQGPMGLFVGAGKGIIRTMYMKSESHADFVPADLVINGILGFTWNYLSNPEKQRFVNLVVGPKNVVSWEELINVGKSIIFNEIPFNGAVWYPGGSIKKSRLVHNVCFYLFQMVPAIFIDVLLFVLGYKPILVMIQRRIQKGGDVFEYYTNRAWNFSNLEIEKLDERMNDVEKEIYKLNGDGFDIKNYLKECMMCVRRNNLKESDESLPAAKRHMKIMWTVDILVRTIIMLALLYYIYKLVKPLLSS